MNRTVPAKPKNPGRARTARAARLAQAANRFAVCGPAPRGFAAKREWTANLFCMTEAEARIRGNGQIPNRARLMTVARQVKRDLRGMMGTA